MIKPSSSYIILYCKRLTKSFQIFLSLIVNPITIQILSHLSIHLALMYVDESSIKIWKTIRKRKIFLTMEMRTQTTLMVPLINHKFSERKNSLRVNQKEQRTENLVNYLERLRVTNLPIVSNSQSFLWISYYLKYNRYCGKSIKGISNISKISIILRQ